ncbi:MAG TPA: carboxypeptidase-like regulatory domain-containing protein, partial [Brumimicrobium sp.]|nr:carboxypeptidase-like regulatory domain-containing protein [Brumimicrobium sp.]
MRFALFLFCLLFGQFIKGQHIVQGVVSDEQGQGIPFADIYVKNTPDLRTRADIEGKYLMRLEVGEYYLVFSASGFEDREHYLIVR